MSREERFMQPVEDTEIVSRATGPRTVLAPEILDDARRRIANGEDLDKITTELAVMELELLGEDVESRSAAFNPDQPRDEQGQWTSTGSGSSFTQSDSNIDIDVKKIDSTGLPGTEHVRPGSGARALLFRASVNEGPNQQGAIWAFARRKDAVDYAKNSGGEVRSILLSDIGDIGEVSDFAIEMIGFDATVISNLKEKGFTAVVNNGEDVGERGEQWLIVDPHAVIKSRGAASHDTPLHKAADSHIGKLSVAFRYAFTVSRSVLRKTHNVDRTIKALQGALTQVLPGTLVKVLASGGEVAIEQLRVAAFNPDQPRDEQGQWTNTGGNTAIDFDDDFYDKYPNAPDLRDKQVDVDNIIDQLVAKDAFDEDGFLPLYHVTLVDNKNSILKEGLIPAKESAPGQNWIAEHAAYSTYFFRSKEHAIDQAQQSGDWFTVIKAQLPVTEKLLKRLVPDEDTGMGPKEGIEALLAGENVGVIGGVPAYALTEIKVPKVKQRELAEKFKFNSTSKQVLNWAKEHSAELVTNISETTRERLQQSITDLVKDGDWSSAIDEILEAIGDEDRAELIARHETMLAASEGQRQAWEQAVEEGFLTGNEQRTWITTPDERLCPICEDLDGKSADLDGMYPGDIDGPPAHVNCRCTEAITG